MRWQPSLKSTIVSPGNASSSLFRKPRPRVIRNLQWELAARVDPESGALVSIDNDPQGRSPVDAFVTVDPRGAIRIVIYPTGNAETVLRLPDLDSDRAGQGDFEPLADSKMVQNLAANIRLFMQRTGVDLQSISACTGICLTVLTNILNAETAASLDEVCNLAEAFETTVEALLSPPQDRRAGE